MVFGGVTHIPFPFRCDYLKISNEKNKTFEAYCGVKTGRHVYVTGKVAVLTFHSDYSFQRRGFLVFFTTIPIGKYKWLNTSLHFTSPASTQNSTY